MNCNCKNIEPIFLQEIENAIFGYPVTVRKELQPKLQSLAIDCGFEKDENGQWAKFPKQEAFLNKIGPYTIIQEHDDGDLTIDSRNWGKAVVTTEGEIFYAKKL